MEEEGAKLKIMVIYPNGVVGDIYLDSLPKDWHKITIDNKSFKIVSHHESMVQRGMHNSFPNQHWDHVIILN